MMVMPVFSSIDEILKKGESDKIEFKSSLGEWRDILETICAFSNTKGGLIIIGVDDKGNVLGVDIGRKSLERLENDIHQFIDPKVYPEISIKAYDNKLLIVISVEEGFNKPYFFRGRAFKRIGRSNRILSRDEIEKMLREKFVTFDSLQFKRKFDIDEELVKEVIYRARMYRGMKIRYDDLCSALLHLGVYDGKNFNNAAVLLFSDPSIYFPQACIKIGFFRKDEIVDERLIAGSILKQVDEALDFLKKYMYKGFEIQGVKRIEKWEYPLEAVREAIVNAVIHRDYFSTAPIFIRMDEYSIVVENPGTLPLQISIEDLKRTHPSIPRNPIIAKIFFYWGYFEEWGRGTLMMIKKCIENGLPEPEFIEEKGFFKVVLKNRKYIIKTYNENMVKTLELIKARKELYLQDLIKILGFSEKTVRNYINMFVDHGLIEKIKVGRRIKIIYKE